MAEKRKLTVKKYFRLFDYNIYDDGSYASDKIFTIQMFGVDEKGKKLCAYVDDYKPFFYIKAHDNWTNMEMANWKSSLDTKYQKYIIRMKLVEHHKLYGFSGGKKHKFYLRRKTGGYKITSDLSSLQRRKLFKRNVIT